MQTDLVDSFPGKTVESPYDSIVTHNLASVPIQLNIHVYTFLYHLIYWKNKKKITLDYKNY